MNKLRFGTAAGLIIAALLLAACTPPTLDTGSEVQYGENGERLVNLTLSMGGNGDARSLSADTSRTSINYYEVAFDHNDYAGYYFRSFYRGESVRMAVPPGVYDNDTLTPGHGRAVLFAGHRDMSGKLRLLAWGIITGVYDNSTDTWDRDITASAGQTITSVSSAVEFTLIGLEYEPYQNTSNQAPSGFQIISPSPAAWQQVPGSFNLNGNRLLITGTTREISYYPLPAQALGNENPLTIGSTDYWSKDINGDGVWYDGNTNTLGAIAGDTITGEWGATGIPTVNRPDGDVNSPDEHDVITAQFQIKNLPDRATNLATLINMVTGPSTPSIEVNAIPVDIGPDPGIPIITRSNDNNHAGPMPYQINQGTLDASVLGGQFTGDINTATATFDVILKTYPLPSGKSGGWALLNARIYVQALQDGEPCLKTWVIETGADLFALDESMKTESLGGSILCAIGTPLSQSVSSGILINGNNP